MKKILSLLMILLVVFSLVACNNSSNSEKTPEDEKTVENEEQKSEGEEQKSEDKNTPSEWVEPTDSTTFEQYLSTKINSFNSAKLDELVSSVEIDPTEIINAIKVPALAGNIECTGSAMETGMHGANATLWQEGSVLYLNAGLGEETELGKLDLTEVSAMIPSLEGVKPSDAINGLLADAFDSTDITLDTFLNKINFTAADFNDLGNGVYELKLEAVARIIADLSMGSISADEILAEIQQTGMNISTKVTYTNGKVRNLTVELKLEVVQGQYTMKQAQTVSFDLFYGPEGLNGYRSSVVAEYAMPNVDLELTAMEEVTTEHLKLDLDCDMKFTSYDSEDKISVATFEAKASGELTAEKAECDLDVKLAAEDVSLTAKGNLDADATKAEGAFNLNVNDGSEVVSVVSTLNGNATTTTLETTFEVKDVENTYSNKVEVALIFGTNALNGLLTVSEDNETLGTIGVDATFADNWLKTGKVEVTADGGVMTINLIGGSSVTIPNVNKAEAEDLLALMMGSGSSQGGVAEKDEVVEEEYYK